MATLEQTIPPPESRRQWLLALLAVAIIVGLAVLLLVVSVLSSFRLGSDTAAVRNAAMKSAKADWSRKIEVGIPPYVAGVARAVLLFSHLEPEARTGLQAFRGGDVGVYEWHSQKRAPDTRAMLVASDEVMTRRGWDRVVGVLNHDELVAAYVPRQATALSNMKVCLVVLNDRELVVASVRSNLEPVLEMVQKQPEWLQNLVASIRL